MDYDTFSSLPLDCIFEFTTYLGEKFTRVPYTFISNGEKRCAIIPAHLLKEFNESSLVDEEKVINGIIQEINPEVIDSYNSVIE